MKNEEFRIGNRESGIGNRESGVGSRVQVGRLTLKTFNIQPTLRERQRRTSYPSPNPKGEQPSTLNHPTFNLKPPNLQPPNLKPPNLQP
ncbi:hypothetical protein BJP36_32380 [Moorena producens JHB]|uniref:Uncharacterized protein n=1 Tax=Moorena producens (strain JHB) TaxID=1454205 RepID=A0A1D9G8K0_MOOP1|nr:hypothetical protein [Moorena producens]AOY83923.1 hypothetical protein BJP36_32380 [Moorena producens JHB]